MSIHRSRTKAELVEEVASLREEIEALRDAKKTSEKRRFHSEELRNVNVKMVRIQQELQANETFLEAIIDNLPAMLFVKDAEELRFLRVNKAGQEIIGFSAEELLGKNDYDFFPKEEADFYTAKDRKVLRDEKLEDIPEEPIHTRDRGTRYLHTKKVPILDPITGKPAFLLGISQDITEQKKLQEELQAAYEELERRVEERTEQLLKANDLLERELEYRKRQAEERKEFEAKLRHAQKLESLGVLAGGIAHDFNNLLVGMLGNADMALAELSKDSAPYQLVEQIHATALQASDLTKQMLAYSGRGKFQIQSIHLSELASKVSDLLQAAIPRNVLLHTELPEELPLFEGDPSQIQQVLMNLLINAAESYGGKGGSVALRVGQYDWKRPGVTDTFTGNKISVGRYVFLEVTDEGCGMDEATQSKLFEPFYTTKFTGRGLGLAAVLGIVRGHQGMIKINSELNKGTKMTVYFPATMEMAKPSSEETLPPQLLTQWEGSTILVIDDDPVVRLVVRNMLQRSGLRPILANDGEEGLVLFAKYASEIAAVILDLTMPRMGGEETFREMRRIHPDVPILLCSGYSQEEATEAFVGCDIAGFLEKPFTLSSLQQKLAQALSDAT